MKKLAVYVDGFNLYHALKDLQKPHLEWLNLFKLAQELAYSSETVCRVAYFSAFATWLPSAHWRHRQYVKALEVHGVDVVLAHFKEKKVSCRACKENWISREEKETDVHLALQLLRDAEDDVYDRMILITADSDLVPAIRMVKTRHPRKRVVVAVPPRRYPAGRHLQTVADAYFAIGTQKIAGCIFPKNITDDRGNLVTSRPSKYDP